MSKLKETSRKPCRKCLLSEWDDEALYQSILEYIAAIPPENKTDPQEYERRLGICKTCNHLINGMCTVCGCYVELRAAKKEQRCAKDDEFWNTQSP